MCLAFFLVINPKRFHQKKTKILAHSNASPGGTATLIPHVGLGVTRKIDTTGDGTTVTAHARDGNGSTAGTYHDTVRIDEMTLSDNERERTDHPQPDLSQRPVLSRTEGNIYSTPVKEIRHVKSRLQQFYLMKDLGVIDEILGCKVIVDRDLDSITTSHCSRAGHHGGHDARSSGPTNVCSSTRLVLPTGANSGPASGPHSTAWPWTRPCNSVP